MHKGINTTLDEGHTPVLAYRVAGDGAAYETEEVTAPLTTRTDPNSQLVTFSTKLHNTKSNQAGKLYEEYTTGLERSSPPPAVVSVPMAVHENQRAELTLSDTAHSLKGPGGKPGQGYQAVLMGPVVRKLLPVECERLQGFPEGWTDVAGLSDTARYKALGNSWPVPVVRWIGRRIQEAVNGKTTI